MTTLGSMALRKFDSMGKTAIEWLEGQSRAIGAGEVTFQERNVFIIKDGKQHAKRFAEIFEKRKATNCSIFVGTIKISLQRNSFAVIQTQGRDLQVRMTSNRILRLPLRSA